MQRTMAIDTTDSAPEVGTVKDLLQRVVGAVARQAGSRLFLWGRSAQALDEISAACVLRVLQGTLVASGATLVEGQIKPTQRTVRRTGHRA